MSWRTPRRAGTGAFIGLSDGGEAGDDEVESQPAREGDDAIFQLCHLVRFKIREAVDSSMTWDGLRTPASELGIIRPLVQDLTKTKHQALIFALLLNRVRFLHEAEDEIAFQGLFNTRAMVCELVAIRSLSTYSSRALHLVSVLTTPWDGFSGATLDAYEESDRPTEEQFARLKRFGQTERANALELGILSQAKKFIATALVSRTLDVIYCGDIRYQPLATRAILRDDHKALKTIEVYDPANRPALDHYRLRVPRIRAWLELTTFAIVRRLPEDAADARR